jgi:hypothetical protein
VVNFEAAATISSTVLIQSSFPASKQTALIVSSATNAIAMHFFGLVNPRRFQTIAA